MKINQEDLAEFIEVVSERASNIVDGEDVGLMFNYLVALYFIEEHLLMERFETFIEAIEIKRKEILDGK